MITLVRIHVVVIALLLGSCIGNRATVSSQGGVADSMHYAKGFSITRHDDFTEVELRDPWDTMRMMHRYLLVPREAKKLPSGMPSGTVVRTPVKRVVVYTSVHASIMELLRASESVVGACEVRYIDSDLIRQRIESGEVADLGEATAPNIEKMIDVEAEAIFSSPFKDAGYGPAEKLGLPILEGADYMETHPLGRVEWLKFYGIMMGREDVADSLFRATSREYLELKKIVSEVDSRPTVLAERRYAGQWLVPGGDSYNAILFEDAGADYMFDNIEGGGSVPLSFESVLDRAMHADMWLFKYYGDVAMSYDALRDEYTPYAHFDAFKNRKIFGCNTNFVTYYEDVPMHPQMLLKDYIKIFHPELLPDYELRYFAPLE